MRHDGITIYYTQLLSPLENIFRKNTRNKGFEPSFRTRLMHQLQIGHGP